MRSARSDRLPVLEALFKHSHFTRPMTCLAGLRDVCPLNESLVAFDTVAQLVQQNCRALMPNIYVRCEDFSTCLSQTEFAQFLEGLNKDPASVMDKLLDAGLWCRYMEQIAGCIVSSGRSCNLTADGLRSARASYQQLTQACHGRGGE
ncbi:hypothetical protein BaRGS_00033668 [Batillaria attramentaria]|uniref:Uncharacterized protein n=1 Tax=Batillaria attramentaria TaxID=370345 RepID=A0ABD0JJQ6_9CAEN